MENDINKDDIESRVKKLENEMGKVLEQLKSLESKIDKTHDEFKNMWSDMNDRVNGELKGIHETLSVNLRQINEAVLKK